MPIWGLWTQGLPLAFRGNHTNYCNLNSSAWLTFGIVKEMPFSRWRGSHFRSWDFKRNPNVHNIICEIKTFFNHVIFDFLKHFYASSHYQTKLNIHKLWSFEELWQEWRIDTWAFEMHFGGTTWCLMELDMAFENPFNG